MHGAERRLAMVKRRSHRPDCGEHRLGPRRRLRIRHEAAVMQLDRRSMGELTGIEIRAHRLSMAASGAPEKPIVGGCKFVRIG